MSTENEWYAAEDAEDEEEDAEDGGWGGGMVRQQEIIDQYEFFDQVKRAYGVQDDLLAAMLAFQIRASRIEQAQLRVLDEIRTQRDSSVAGRFPVEMSHDVPADTGLTEPNEVERVPHEQGHARIGAVSLGWTDGSENAVGIRLETGNGLTLLPRNPQDDFIAFNDFSETFPLQYTLQPGEKLLAKTVNLDTTNSHFVNIVPHVSEVLDEVGEREIERQKEMFPGVDGDGD